MAVRGLDAGGRADAGQRRLTIVRALPLQFLVRMINEWGTAPRRAADEHDQDYPDFAVLVAAHQLDLSPAIKGMSNRGLTRVADSLYPIFSAPTEDAAVAFVNDLLARGSYQPRLSCDAGRLAERWTAQASQQLLAACVLTLCQYLIRWGDNRRLGSCGGTRCANVYVDLSPTGQKRFCSLTCQNRNRVAAFRANRRHRGGPAAS
jgi:hypothetical protein